MECACIQGDFRFSLDVTSCHEVYFTDNSRWMEEYGYSRPETYTIKISRNGSVSTQEVSTKGSTKLEGFSGECWQDGYYEISTESCDVPYTRPTVILCNLECCLLEATTKGIPTEDLFEVHYAIEGAKRQGLVEDQEGFEIFYHRAKTLLRGMACNCQCK